METILFVSHPEEQCGVHQFGKQVFGAISKSERYRFVYAEVSSEQDLSAAIGREAPRAIIVNWHPSTMGRIGVTAFWTIDIPTIGLLHEANERIAYALDDTDFNYFILHDPSANVTNPIIFRSGRLIPHFEPRSPAPDRITIGSFGFATPGKGFENLVARAHAEFDDCLIRLNIPYAYFGDTSGASAHQVADRCRSIITKPRVDIEIFHDFLPIDGVLEFLSGNSLNAFFYETGDDRGISSAVDLALAAGRPIALRRATMFRHMFDVEPSIFVEERSLREILASGTGPLAALRSAWTEDNMCRDYETMLDKVLCEFRQMDASRFRARSARQILRMRQDFEVRLEAIIHQRMARIEQTMEAQRHDVNSLQVAFEAQAAAFETRVARLEQTVEAQRHDVNSLQSAIEKMPSKIVTRALQRFARSIRKMSTLE